MGRDFSYRIIYDYTIKSESDKSDSYEYEYDDNISRHNDYICEGKYNYCKLLDKIVEYANEINNSEDRNDILEAIMIYSRLAKEMDETCLVKIRYR